MNMKKILTKTWLYPASIIAMLVLGGLVYPDLPAQMPSRWGFNGEVNSYMPKELAILMIPALTFLLWVVLTIVPYIDPRSDQYEKFESSYIRLKQSIAVFLLILHVMMMTQYDNPMIMVKGILFGVAMLFAVLGNEMGRIRQTFFTGIRTPWTLADERVWRKTHRVGARWMTGVGVLNMIVVPVLPMPIAGIFLLVTLMGVSLAITAYSYVVYQQLN